MTENKKMLKDEFAILNRIAEEHRLHCENVINEMMENKNRMKENKDKGE